MNNNMIKFAFVLSTLILTDIVQVQATNIKSNQDNQEFEVDKINRIFLKVDKSQVEFLPVDGGKIKVERHKVDNFNSAHLSMTVNNNVLEIQSINPGRGGCEVNYRVMLPKISQVEVEAGNLDFHSTTPFSHLSLSTGSLRGKICDPNCDIQVKSGKGELDITFRKILSIAPHIAASMGKGILNVIIPEDSTVNYNFNAPPSASRNLTSAYVQNVVNPNFRINFSTGSGFLNIMKHLSRL